MESFGIYASICIARFSRERQGVLLARKDVLFDNENADEAKEKFTMVICAKSCNFALLHTQHLRWWVMK